MVNSAVGASCDSRSGALNKYESQVLAAAEEGRPEKMAFPLSCIMQMQSENEGISRYLASSYLRPLLGGKLTPGLVKDRRYQLVANFIEQITLRSSDAIQDSFVSDFSKGDWRFYTLFCEEGNTAFCSDFLPDEQRVKSEPPLLAAASMLRLRKAFQVLKGPQRDLVAERIKNLYREIPQSARLQRKFIEQIYNELFPLNIPLSKLS